MFVVTLPVQLYFWLIYYTARVKLCGYEESLSKKPVVYVFWHRYLLFFTIYNVLKKLQAHYLISFSDTGRYASFIASFFNVNTVWKYKKHHRKCQPAVDLLIEQIRKDNTVAMMPDGSRGPGFKLKHGCLQVSKGAGCPIVPVTFNIKGKIKFKSWDKFLLPLPFCKVEMTFHPAMQIPSDTDNLEEAKEQLENLLNSREDTRDLA